MRKTLVFLSLCLCLPSAVSAKTVKIIFRAALPSYTPENADIFITGGGAALGNWDPAGVKLARSADGTWRTELYVENGSVLEYKYTRGGWDTVEKGADFEEVENRRLKISGAASVDDKVFNWADRRPAARNHTLAGTVKYHENFYSKYLKNKRTLAVYLPPSYGKDEKRRYPVVYMHDGQNVFDSATSFLGEEWRADEAAEELAMQEPGLEAVIVGVYNTADRINEYTPWKDAERGGGKGRDYAKFIVKEVKPFVDKNYRTLSGRENTATAGSSLGGIISFYLAMEYPKIFSKAGVISPSLYWAGKKSLTLAVEKADPFKASLWLSMGTEEGDQKDGESESVADSRELKEILLKKGFQENKNLFYLEEKGGRHSERYWAKLMPEILKFLLTSEKP